MSEADKIKLAFLDEFCDTLVPTEEFMAVVEEALQAVRRQTIEECAKVAEDCCQMFPACGVAVAAIRSLHNEEKG